jgi:hypothetical protein
MKKNIFKLFAILPVIMLSCNNEKEKMVIDPEKSKEELRVLEAAFADSVSKYGFNKSLLMFADEKAVLFREGDSTILNMDSIRVKVSKIPANAPPPPFTLTWKPDFIDVSSSGDMGYTYGYYILTQKNSSGKEEKTRGLYLSIWKKNESGKWKLVVD